MPRLLTFLSDYGLTDTYVGQAKGAVLAVCPEATIVDLTHAVPPQDVRAGAYLLQAAVGVFPPGTAHLAIVDPGVGTPRRPVLLQAARGDLLIGPDNGLLIPAAERLGGVARAIHLAEPRFFREPVSQTFHGRDVFGPAAGHVLAGASLDGLGPAAERLVEAAVPVARREAGTTTGEVVHVDGFGNLITNLPRALLPRRFDVRIGEHRIHSAPHPAYQAVAPGELLALLGSDGTLEIAARDGNAAGILDAGVGVRVVAIPS